MPASQQAQRLNALPIKQFKTIFATLQSPELAAVKGVYRSMFTGPAWLRAIAPPGLWPLGLGGWQGKWFSGDGEGLNLVLRGGELRRKFPIRATQSPSLIDGAPCLSIHYTRECPFPWPYVIDELRSLDENCLLGLTMVNLKSLLGLALPFLLYHQEGDDGL